MSSWLEDGRPAILDALAAAFDKVDERARAEIELRNSKNEELLEELQTLRSRVAQVDRLRQENESLQAEIGRLQEIRDVTPVFHNERTALAELSPNKPTTSHRASTSKGLPGIATGAQDSVKYKAVVARCKELDAKYKGARKLLEDHRLTLRKRNETIDAWARHSDALQKTIENLRARLRLHSSDVDTASAAQADEADDDTTKNDGAVDFACLKRPSPDSKLENEPPSSPPSIALTDVNFVVPSPRRLLSEPPPRLSVDDASRVTGNGTSHETACPTADDLSLPSYPDQLVEACLATVKVELSSDAPVVVSTRSARKRKRGGDDSEGGSLLRVKPERSSSSGPEIVRESHHYSPAESIDFDEEVHVPTPRKRRALSQYRREDVAAILEGTPNSGLLFPGHVTLEASIASEKSRTPSHVGVDRKRYRSSALLDAFPQLHWSDRAAMVDNSAKPNASPLALGVMDLADDGEAEGVYTRSRNLQPPVVKSRLDALLNSPSKKNLTPINRDHTSRVQTPQPAPVHDGNGGASSSVISQHVLGGNTASPTTTIPRLRQSTRASLSPKSSAGRERGPKKPSILRDDMPRGRSMNKEGTPLRERAIERLRPEDFKPNPLYNDGLTFVYDEVVRGKEARAALSGCIDPTCCGKTFRHFAETELKSVGSSVMIRAEDVALMERYLGDEAFKLGTMTREEREELWLTVKTRELANKFGKHRHRYSRMPTPPGFWSMDFPNTQERAEELRQAEAIRKALVSDRYREAMRCKGSWLFRDEDPR